MGKEKRQIYDYIGEKKLAPEGSVLMIDPTKDNPVDKIFTQLSRDQQHFGLGFHPRQIVGWWAIGVRKRKKIAGRVISVLVSRDLLVRTPNNERQVIPFEHCVYLKKNPA